MSTTGSNTATSNTVVPPTLRQRFNIRRVLIVAALLLLVSILTAWMTAGQRVSQGNLDPANPDPIGGRAVAEVLRQQGVDVEVPRSAEDFAGSSFGPDTTVLITSAIRLTPATWREQLAAARGASRIVVVEPPPGVLREIDPYVSVRGRSAGPAAGAGCAEFSGLTMDAKGSRYEPGPGTGATLCFIGDASGGDQSAAIVDYPRTADRPRITVVGNDAVLANGRITSRDHAAISLRLLGGTDRLIWWPVSRSDLDRADAPETVWPGWIEPVAYVLGFALVLFLLAQGRRLGPLVTEPLPVVVRARETTETRGQLYRRSADSAQMIGILQRGTRSRLRQTLSLPRGARPLGPDEIRTVAVAAGREPIAIDTLLNQIPDHPGADAMVRIAQELARIEEEVRPR